MEKSLSNTPTAIISTRTSTDAIDLVRSLPFIGVHVACLAVVWTGVSTTALVLSFLTLAIRMFRAYGRLPSIFLPQGLSNDAGLSVRAGLAGNGRGAERATVVGGASSQSSSSFRY